MRTTHATRRTATLGLCSLLGLCAAATGASAAATTASAADAGALANPAIDADGYLRTAVEAARHRATRRPTEDAFIALSREPGTVILDARSREKYDELHVRGAVHLAFPDITAENLARVLPDRNVRILIYRNVWELGPFVDARATRIEFASAGAPGPARR